MASTSSSSPSRLLEGISSDHEEECLDVEEEERLDIEEEELLDAQSDSRLLRKSRAGRFSAAKLAKPVLVLAALAVVAALASRRLSWSPSASTRFAADGPPDMVGLTSDQTFRKFEGLNCYPLRGASLLEDNKDDIGQMTKDDCSQACLIHSDCEGFVFVSNRDYGFCWLRKGIEVSKCIKNTVWDVYVKPGTPAFGEKAPEPVSGPKTSETAVVSAGFFALKGYNCWSATKGVAGSDDAIAEQGLESCREVCSKDSRCEGFILGQKKQPGLCWLRLDLDLAKCKPNIGYDPQDWDFYVRQKNDDPGLKQFSGAPMHEFYMYRATAPGNLAKYTLGEVNTANLDGVLWYLMNEIVTDYSGPPRCPRRFGISKVHRFKVKVRPTLPLSKEKMSFGVRFAFDQGRCTGRCFPGNQCTGRGDCAYMFGKYGYVVGCNRFESRYPFPDEKSKAYVSTPNGVWYSLPIEGRCSGDPTGTADCTWSYEEAGELSLEEIESISPGGDNCCNNKCTSFWDEHEDSGKMYWRIGKVLDMFKDKFPQWPRDLKTPYCDFDVKKWYPTDNWPRHDPWH